MLERNKAYSEFSKATEKMLYDVENYYGYDYDIIPDWMIQCDKDESHFEYEFSYWDDGKSEWIHFTTDNTYKAFEEFLEGFWAEYNKVLNEFKKTNHYGRD